MNEQNISRMFDGAESPVCPFCQSTEGFRLRGYRGLGFLLLCDRCGKEFVESLKVKQEAARS